MPRGKIGIFLPGQNGDIAAAMSVLKYRDILWPNHDIVWFCGTRNRDMLVHNSAIDEIRHWPEGWGLPERCQLENLTAVEKGEPLWADFTVLKDSNNRLNDRKFDFESTKDLEQGYFPAPWMSSTSQRGGLDYPNIPRKVFSADFGWEWHPYLGFSEAERDRVKHFCMDLPSKKTIMLETSFGSGKSPWDDDLTREVMAICREKLGRCNFIFACAGDNSRFADEGVVTCNDFTVRQTALMNNYSDLFIGISSGISHVVNCWHNKPTPKIQYCGSFIMSTASLANGPFELVVTDPAGMNPPDHERRYPPNPNHREEFKAKLTKILEVV